MKRIYLLLILSLCAGISSAEVVSAITFNPSRLGTYTHLRAANSAVLAGGLETETMNVSSADAGTVSVTTPSSDNIYVATKVRPVENASLVAVNMPNTTFNVTESGSKVQINGGSQTYKTKSVVDTLISNFLLVQYANTFTGNTLTISGNAKDGQDLFSPGTHSNGFYLAGNDIPEPVAAYTNGAGDLTGCKWAWVDRQGAKVLALDGCDELKAGPTTKTCKWTLEGDTFDTNMYPGVTVVNANPRDKTCTNEGDIVFWDRNLNGQDGSLTITGPYLCVCNYQ